MNRAVVVGGAVLGTTVLLGLALSIGGWGFDQRRFSLHEGRLRRLVEKEPKAAQVAAALRAEQADELGVAQSAAEREQLAARWGRERQALVLEKGLRWAEVRAFAAADMVYFLYFDGDGVLRDFLCVSR